MLKQINKGFSSEVSLSRTCILCDKRDTCIHCDNWDWTCEKGSEFCIFSDHDG